ncbi:uncharacterized protein A4U43_C02F380 [Asparagus officinalis]|uniref:Uncharacterized protein n=1 Tax=Asparagus officinalis TaxID=4686 RepID=A0A5P1FJK7_ASPOF|nr:uncharacterized protein A4U43_C02F380 [Asparagus officinalis]
MPSSPRNSQRNFLSPLKFARAPRTDSIRVQERDAHAGVAARTLAAPPAPRAPWQASYDVRATASIRDIRTSVQKLVTAYGARHLRP